MERHRARLFTLEQQTIAAIPAEDRHGRSRELVSIWFGMNMTPLTVVTGATASSILGLSLWWSAVAIILGHAIGGVGMALHAAQGPQLGVPQMLQARGQFGSYGASLVVLVASIMFVGYFSSNLIVTSDSIRAVAPGINGTTVLVVCAAVSLVITAFGYSLVRLVTSLSAYIVGALVALSALALIVQGDVARHLGDGGFTWTAFSAMLAIGVVWQLTYAPYVSDYSRYMPKDTGVRGAFWGSYAGCVSSSAFLMIVGAVVGVAATGTDTMSGLEGLLGGVLGLAVMLGFAAAASTGNSVNAYCSSLCVLTFVETFKQGWRPALRARLVTAFLLHVIGLWIAIAAQSSFATSYYNFLSVLLYVLIPWSAINLVDYYLVRDAHYVVEDFFAADGGRYGRWNVGALVVFFVGVLVQIPFMTTTAYTGPVASAMGGVDIAWLVGLGVSAAAYLLVARVWPQLIGLDPAEVRSPALQVDP